MAALYLFHLGFAWVIGISLAYTIGLTLYQTRKDKNTYCCIRHSFLSRSFIWKLLKSIAITCLFISLVYGYFYLFGGYGFLALLIFVVLLSAYLIYKGRVMFMASMRQIETAVFGKTLDKENWQNGEKPRAKRLGLSRLWRRKA